MILINNTNKKIIILILLSIISLLWATVTGSADINFIDVFKIALGEFTNINIDSEFSSSQIAIICNIRLPRVILAFLIGGALGVSGVIAQSILENPLASPYTLGVSSGASLGSAIVILYGLNIPFLGNFTQLVFGFLFALLTMYLVLLLSYYTDNNMSTTTIILTGMIISLFSNGLLTLLTSLNKDNISQLSIWQMGSFASRRWIYIAMFLPFLILGLSISYYYEKELDLFTFGEEQSKTIGVNTLKVKKSCFLIISLLSGASVAITGTIGFVDLVAPHFARKVFSNNHRILIPTSFLIGGILMLIADTICRTIISPSEISISAITSLFGAPIFFYIYKNRSK